jgi:hypothetical protein
VPAWPREGVRPGEGRRARRLAGGAGKAAGGGGKARGRTVIKPAAVSYKLRGNWRENRLIRGGTCDISGTMSAFAAPVASAAWILARAAGYLPSARHRHRLVRQFGPRPCGVPELGHQS